MVFITGIGKAQQKRKEELPTSLSANEIQINNVLEKKDRTTSLRDFIQGILTMDFVPSIESVIPSLAKGTVVVEETALSQWLDQHGKVVT